MKVDKKIFCFDLDNVICSTKKKYYLRATPKKKVVKLINKLYEKNIIKIFTARFMGRENEIISRAKKRGYNFTKKQLKKWGVKYHYLLMGKPSFDVYVDDKNFEYSPQWTIKFKKKYLRDF